MKKLTVATVAVLSLLAVGCSNPYSNNQYNANRSGIVQNVTYGVITNLRQVTIQDSNNIPVGAVAGGAVGGLLGHMVGGGTGKTLATVGGVVLGGLAGNAVQTQANKTQGLEVEVRLDNGQTIAVTQSGSEDFQIGSRVRVVDAGGRTTLSVVSNTTSGYVAPQQPQAVVNGGPVASYK